MGKGSLVYTFLLTLQEVILIPKKTESNPVLVLMLLCAHQMQGVNLLSRAAFLWGVQTSEKGLETVSTNGEAALEQSVPKRLTPQKGPTLEQILRNFP